MIAEQDTVTEMLIEWRTRITPAEAAIMYAMAQELGYVELARGMDYEVLRQGDLRALGLNDEELSKVARAAAVLSVVDQEPNCWLVVAEVAIGRLDERGAQWKSIGEILDAASAERLRAFACDVGRKIVDSENGTAYLRS